MSDESRNVGTARSDRADQRLRLPDGRRLGFAEFGAADGVPVFVFHGLPGSRLSITVGAAEPARGLRYVCPDRPGMGLSDYQPGRTLLDWPADVVALADALGLERFSVMGGSGGGPYALACAHAIPHRLRHVVVVNGLAPLDRPGALEGMPPLNRFAWWSMLRIPGQRPLVAWLQGRMARRDPAALVKLMSGRMAAADRATIARRGLRDPLVRHVAEAYRSGSRGVARDMAILTAPWGFRLEDIASEVHLWQGEDDRNVPRQMGEHLARAIPHCRATFVPAVGHLMADRLDHIAAVLSSDPGGTGGATVGGHPRPDQAPDEHRGDDTRALEGGA